MSSNHQTARKPEKADRGPGYSEEISVSDCVELLRTQQVGRIGVVVSGRPEIFPVNYSLDASDSIIFRTGIGMKLAAAVNHHVVFEVDRVYADLGFGWSVVVHGVAHQTGRIAEGERPVVSWRDDTPYLVRISTSSVTGRRMRRHRHVGGGGGPLRSA